jgi:hypothetical protein
MIRHEICSHLVFFFFFWKIVYYVMRTKNGVLCAAAGSLAAERSEREKIYTLLIINNLEQNV